MTTSLKVDGHRADLVILKAARAQSALQGRTRLNHHDIALAAELALPHRLKHGPLQQVEASLFNLEEQIEQIQSDLSSMEENVPAPPQNVPDGSEKKKIA